MLDLLYAKRWRISDDDLRELRFGTAVEMYDRLMPCRDIPSILRFVSARCNLCWGYQYWACCDAFGIVPSYGDFLAYWHTDDDMPQDAGFLSQRIYRNSEAVAEPPRDAWLSPSGPSASESDFYDYWAG